MSRGFRICMAKGGKGCLRRAAEVDPLFNICRNAIAVSKIKDTPPIFVREVGN